MLRSPCCAGLALRRTVIDVQGLVPERGSQPGGQWITPDVDAQEFAQLAMELHAQQGLPGTIDAVLDAALKAVGADAASVMQVPRRTRSAPVVQASHPAALRADEMQLECDQGPGLEPMEAGDTIVVPDTQVEPRWPLWTPRVCSELKLRSVMSVRLMTSAGPVSSLTVYAHRPAAFESDDRAVAQILARHAMIAISSASQEDNLTAAIDARKVVGQAQGILMERYHLDADRAFTVLQRYSQDHNVKLRIVAERLIATRQLPR